MQAVHTLSDRAGPGQPPPAVLREAAAFVGRLGRESRVSVSLSSSSSRKASFNKPLMAERQGMDHSCVGDDPCLEYARVGYSCRLKPWQASRHAEGQARACETPVESDS